MHRRLNSLVFVVGIVLLCVFIAVSTTLQTARADTSGGWTGGVPQIQKVGDISQAEKQALPSGTCTRMTIPVVRALYQQLLTNNEEHCMVKTSEGLVDDSVTVFQPNGFSKAYPVDLQMGGSPVLIPTPNYPGALLIHGDSSYPGVDAGLYKELINHLKFNNNPLSPRFSVTAPDLTFKYPNGHAMAFNPPGSFSSSGTYWVVEANFYGFVRINLTTLQMTAFASNTVLNSAGNPLGAETVVSPSGRYAAIAYNADWGDKYFKLVDVDSCGSTAAAYSAATSTCKTANYLPDLQRAIPGLISIGNMTFAGDNSLNFVATIKDGTTYKYARYEITAAGQPQRLEQYLALGDSFASGEGTFNYLSGTDTDTNKCHQSIYAYPALISVRVGSAESVACSGAVIDNIITNNLQHKGNQLKGLDDNEIALQQQNQAETSHLPGVLLQSKFVGWDNPQTITISVGGNDIGFMDIIKRCIIPFNNHSSVSQNCYQTYEDRKELVNTVNGRFDNLVQTYQQLKQADPTRRIYVIGYPQIVQPDGDCGVNVHLSQSDTEFAAQLVNYLDSVIARAAANAGVQYVDTQHAFDGHKLCEAGEKAVNGLTAGNDTAHLIGNESYHPNQLGHELFAGTILGQTHNLTSSMPAPQNIAKPTANDSQASAILQAPKINRVVYEVMNVGEDILYTVPGVTHLTTGQFQGTIAASSTVQAVLHSTPTNIGTLNVDQNGVINGNLQIPADTPPGIHTLHLYGKNIFGDPIDIQETVYLEASASDYDGDGVPNNADSCPAVPQSGFDVDQDGIDDTCDPTIGAAPVAKQSTSSNTSDNGPAATVSQQAPTSAADGTVAVQDAGQVGTLLGVSTAEPNVVSTAAKTKGSAKATTIRAVHTRFKWYILAAAVTVPLTFAAIIKRIKRH